MINETNSRFNTAYNEIMKIQRQDKYRDNKAISLQNFIKRIIFRIKEFFQEGVYQKDTQALDRLYQNLKGRITQLQSQKESIITSDIDQKEGFVRDVSHLVKIKARILMAGWKIQDKKSQKIANGYRQIAQSVSELSKFILENQIKFERTKKFSNRVSWIKIHDDDETLRVAGFAGQVPYHPDELPIGTIVISNYKMREVIGKIRKKKYSLPQQYHTFIEKIYDKFTHNPYTHTLAIIKDKNRNNMIHITKPRDAHCNGKAMRQRWKKKTDLGDRTVLIPNAEKIYQYFDDLKNKQENVHQKESLVSNEELNEFFDNNTKDDISHFLKNTLQPSLFAGEGQPVNIRGIASTAFNRKLPKDRAKRDKYFVNLRKKLLNSEESAKINEQNCSCSGWVNLQWLRAGVVLNDTLKTSKMYPGDYLSVPLFKLAYSPDPKLKAKNTMKIGV